MGKKSAMDLDLDQSSPDKSSKKKRKKKKQLKNADDDSKDAHSTTTSSDTDEESDNTKINKSNVTNVSNNKKGRRGQRNQESEKNHKTTSASGESKGLAGGSISINTNIKQKKNIASPASVATKLSFDDLVDNNSEAEEDKISAGLVSHPKRGQLKSGLKKTVYKSTILGQAIGKLLEKKKFVPQALCPKDDSSDDADVEDELSESDLTMAIKQRPKIVRKSPEKVQQSNSLANSTIIQKSDQSDHSKSKSKTKSPSIISRNNHTTTSSSPPSKNKKSGKNNSSGNGNSNSRFKRAAANKASDRINRESRGRLSLSSSSSDDSRISDLDRGVEDLIKKSRNLISDDDSDFNPKPSNDSQTLSSVIPSSATTTTSRPSSQSVVKIPLKRKVSTGTGNAESGGTSAEKPKKKTKLDNAEEKENKNLAKLTWPEQLVRSKAAKVAAAAASSRATTTSRHSVDSLDSMEMELATPEDKIPSLGNSSKTVATTNPIISNNHDTSTKSKQTTTTADVKNSKNSVKSTSKSRQPIVVLPILGKNKILNAMGSKSKQTANQDQEYNPSTD